MKYLVVDWDNMGLVCSSWRKAKALRRDAEKFSYCVWIKPYRGPYKAGTVLVDSFPQPYTFKQYERGPEE